MKTTTLKLLTIIADESLARVIEEILLASGAKGFTQTEVQGVGRSGSRDTAWSGKNVKIEAIATSEVTEKALESIKADFFEKYAVIAYCLDVDVLRSKHFM